MLRLAVEARLIAHERQRKRRAREEGGVRQYGFIQTANGGSPEYQKGSAGGSAEEDNRALTETNQNGAGQAGSEGRQAKATLGREAGMP